MSIEFNSEEEAIAALMATADQTAALALRAAEACEMYERYGTEEDDQAFTNSVIALAEFVSTVPTFEGLPRDEIARFTQALVSALWLEIDWNEYFDSVTVEAFL